MMKTFVIVPVKKFENAKARLSSILNAEDRAYLASLMLDDTLSFLTSARLHQVIVVSSDKCAQEIARRHGTMFLHEQKESGVNSAVLAAESYCTKQGADATMVLPQDIPLLNTTDVEMACDLAENENKCIVICPSLRYDGTNLLLRKPSFVMETYYDSNSYKTHIQVASERGIKVKLYF